jgi:hypothetical protein
VVTVRGEYAVTVRGDSGANITKDFVILKCLFDTICRQFGECIVVDRRISLDFGLKLLLQPSNPFSEGSFSHWCSDFWIACPFEI